MSDIKTGLMFSPLTERIYWGRMNTKTGFSVGNNQKEITSDFIGIMLQKFPINTRQNITSNGETECVVIVLDEEKAKEYTQAKEQNAQLKADKAELIEMLSGLTTEYDELLEKSINHIGSHGTSGLARSKILLNKHKEQPNDQ